MTSIIYDYPAIAAKMQGDEWWGSKKEEVETTMYPFEDEGVPTSRLRKRDRWGSKKEPKEEDPLYRVSPIPLVWCRIVRGKVVT